MRPSHRFDLLSSLPKPFRAPHWGPAPVRTVPVAVELQERVFDDAIVLRAQARAEKRRKRPLSRGQEGAVIATLVATAIALQITLVLALSALAH